MRNSHTVSKSHTLAKVVVGNKGDTNHLSQVGRIHEARNSGLDFIASLFVFAVIVTLHELGLVTSAKIGFEHFGHVEVQGGFPEDLVHGLALAQTISPGLPKLKINQVTPVGHGPLALHIGVVSHQPGVHGSSVFLPVVELHTGVLDPGNHIGCPIFGQSAFKHSTFSMSCCYRSQGGETKQN